VRRAGLLLAASLSSLAIFSATASGASYPVYICGSWSNNPGPFVPTASSGMSTWLSYCGTDPIAGFNLGAGGVSVPINGSAGWNATAPAGLTITHIYTVHDLSTDVGDGLGWWGEFYWNGGPGPAGGSAQITDSFKTYGCCQASFNAKTVGWVVVCRFASCSSYMYLEVGGVALQVNEDQGPWLVAPSGLWQAQGWIRDRWQLAFSGDSPSGICALYASINGQPVTLGPGAVVGRNSGTWHQCAGASAGPTLQTGDYGQGAMPLTIEGCDAAGACTGGFYTTTIYVDNSHPWVSLASPGDAPVTAGTQYVTATAGGSPSGIAEIDCSVDGAPDERYPEGGAQQPSVQVPVSGLGEHAVQCSAANTAVAQDGSHGWSVVPASTTLKIGEPTLSAISFSKIVDKLRCSRVRKRVRIPAHWVTVRRHHKLVRVHRRARTKVVKVMRCHPRTVQRRVTVWVTVVRHGKRVRVKRKKVVRVVLLPRVVYKAKHRVRHGHGAIVRGWLATATGVPLGGQVVRVLTAADNNEGRFSQAAVVTTAADGGWGAWLPAGPSRLVEAVYDGAATTEASVSGQVRLIVPAEVKLLRVWPRRVPWGATVHLTGELVGGYLPPGGALVRLRLGYGSTYNTYGVQEHVGGNGRFSTIATFGPGDPRIHRTYWFQIASLPMGNYPYAPAASRRVTVIVGGHPASRRPRRHHHRIKEAGHHRAASHRWRR
jgi:hypothetical protein